MSETVKKAAATKPAAPKKAPAKPKAAKPAVVKAPKVKKEKREVESRKVLEGLVVAANSQKTIKVAVESYQMHPLYQKRFKVTKNFQVHDEEGKAKVGDKVSIMETRPISKTKTFRLHKVLVKGGN